MELSTTVVKTQEPDTTETHNPKPFLTTNGVLKRHAPLLHHHGHPVVITYKECLKNHAAAMGGHALDGCGEFMPSPTSDHSDPTSLRCAACGCHRNFHRRDPDVTSTPQPPPIPALEYQPYNRHLPPPPPPRVVGSPNNDNNHNNSPSQSPPPISSTYPHTLLSLSGGGAQHQLAAAAGGYHVAASGGGHVASAGIVGGSSTRIKRCRTRFTQYQKEKMFELAERIGWRMQKRDEEMIMKFCNEIGVERVVFKVWMHNNKNTSTSCNKKSDHQPQHVVAAANLSSTVLPPMLISNNPVTVMMGAGDNSNKENNGIINGMNNNDYDQEMRGIHHHHQQQNLSHHELLNSQRDGQTHETNATTNNDDDDDDSTGTTSGGGSGGVGMINGSNHSSSC